MNGPLGCRPTWSNPTWYGKYRIFSNDTPAPYRYAFVHDDYDGAEDANDNRHGFGNSIEECCDEIDEIEEDLREQVRMRIAA